MSLKKLVSWVGSLFRKRPNKPKPPVVTPPVVTLPTFVETFSTLDLNKWIVSSWAAPMGGKFSADHVSIVDGMLCLKLTQTVVNGTIVSTGGEVATREKFGYGTYEFEVKASSDNPVPTQPGSPVSGSITGCFNYGPTSITEIDMEVEGGARFKLAQFTSWKGEGNPNEHTTFATYLPPHAKFYTYKFVWTPSSITFFVDGTEVSKHTKVVPTAAAPFLFNHWGTDNINWGGPATVDRDRFMFVKGFRFTPL